MKKVSEVQKELRALGCNEDMATKLLIACGVLEEDKKEIKESRYQMGDIWLDKNGNTARKITSIDSQTHDAFYPQDNNHYNLKLSFGFSHHDFHKLIWREPK